MGSSTNKKLKLEREMIRRNSKPIGLNIFELDKIEMVDSKEKDDDD